MDTYKIRINCSSKNYLSFNNKKINNKIYDDIIYALNPETIDYIYKIVISYEDYYSPENTIEFTNKYLDIIFNRYINNDEYKSFINNLINIGFKGNYEDTDDYNFNNIINEIKNPKIIINETNDYISRQKNLYIKEV
jgi:hypothetical protein